ncbi:hypothetical protein OG943_29435 [Amycolatopsis sp. NBC_00345]|uniref:hypothetical protein n=1 Tax=Amycolatopsis sp. NBC_00345 TaxID=2975955 RepID=UPI002E26C858
MRQDFEQAATDLARPVSDVTENVEDSGPSLDPLTEAPVYQALLRELERPDAVPALGKVDLQWAARRIAVETADLVRQPRFPAQADARNDVRKALRFKVEEHLHVEWGDTADMAAGLLELAVERCDDFLRYGARPPR